jgi:hyperosmotically inducible periplasmic protein
MNIPAFPFRKTLFATGIAAALALSGTAAAHDGNALTETRQETQIWTTYALSPYLRASDLKVSVKAGKATLTGTVDEDVNRDLATQIALGVDGVKEVDNQIAVQADYLTPARAGRSYGEIVDDATITAAIKSKLLWSKHTDGLTTDVDTKNGKVTLTGKADSGASKDFAARLAMNTDGVASVNNQLMVETGKPGMGKSARKAAHEAKGAVADSWITTKVKSTFLYSSNVDGTDITVSTVGGIVTLSGNVSGPERALAIEFAKNVRGVKSVQAKSLIAL